MFAPIPILALTLFYMLWQETAVVHGSESDPTRGAKGRREPGSLPFQLLSYTLWALFLAVFHGQAGVVVTYFSLSVPEILCYGSDKGVNA
jgi:hypothetical protein